eukprot:jgi/Psemu1/326728/estExt_fgenesh1_pg.C_4520002
MNSSYDNDLVYPNLTVCQVKVLGSAATSRPPVQLPQAIRERAATPPYSPVPAAGAGSNGGTNAGGCPFDDFSLERAVLKRKEERDRDWSLKGATSREALEHATVSKMRNVTGAEEDVCISILRDHGYDVEESIEAYLDRPH